MMQSLVCYTWNLSAPDRETAPCHKTDVSTSICRAFLAAQSPLKLWTQNAGEKNETKSTMLYVWQRRQKVSLSWMWWHDMLIWMCYTLGLSTANQRTYATIYANAAWEAEFVNTIEDSIE